MVRNSALTSKNHLPNILQHSPSCRERCIIKRIPPGERTIVQTIHNFRDFGGFPVQDGSIIRKGLLYRSGSLAEASDEDLAHLSSLGIRTVIDMRTHRERNQAPDRLPQTDALTYLHLPIKVSDHYETSRLMQLASLMFGQGRKIDFHQVSVQSYQEFVTGYKPEFGQVLKLVGDETRLPLLIHCTAGKDRTGFAAGLIQLLLGAPLEVVLQDYLLSNDLLETFQLEMQRRMKFLRFLGIPLEKFLPLFEVRREYLQASWEQIQRDYGTLGDYLRQGLGLMDQEQYSLRRLLLEQSPT